MKTNDEKERRYFKLYHALKTGHYVCMFAEGNITYDGATAPLASVNGKLFRALQCTVVTVSVTGDTRSFHGGADGFAEAMSPRS